MPRELNDRDREILAKLAPECTDLVCSGSGVPFRSLLPPVANHFARDEADFRERIGRLNDEELRYLADLVLVGEESLGCVPPDFLEIFLWRVAERLGDEAAVQIVERAAAGECPNSDGAEDL
ncbi:MAG: hypothetical protein LUP93_04840 [Methanomicrobiales archaeon]|nr:hypothetical protein [Methanomicrobiales archaeon]MDD1646830.1 hypothetical protein [Methanomicrobiales archaeon]